VSFGDAKRTCSAQASEARLIRLQVAATNSLSFCAPAVRRPGLIASPVLDLAMTALSRDRGTMTLSGSQVNRLGSCSGISCLAWPFSPLDYVSPIQFELKARLVMIAT
jgi:hypothetical protein